MAHDPTVAINAQIAPGKTGGIETNLLALLHSLHGRGKQIVVGPGARSDWLQVHLSTNQQLEVRKPVKYDNDLFERAYSERAALFGRKASLFGKVSSHFFRPKTPLLDEIGAGLAEKLVSLGAELIHFPYQRHYPTPLPMIFEPWDLQHRHLTEFFSQEEIRLRDEIYGSGCRNSDLVVVASAWTKQDVVRQFGVRPEKVAVIARGPGLDFQGRLSREQALQALGGMELPARFLLYPAKTWPHKNHARLFAALANLRSTRGVEIPLVCTGKPVEESWLALEESLQTLGLAQQVRFTGHVDDEQIRAIYSLAEALIFPSLFEGLGIPLLEAMRFGLPIATSDVTCLREVTAGAALHFDATSTAEIAGAIESLWTNAALRADLVQKALARSRDFDWARTAEDFLLCYRFVARRKLNMNEKARLAQLTGAA